MTALQWSPLFNTKYARWLCYFCYNIPLFNPSLFYPSIHAFMHACIHPWYHHLYILHNMWCSSRFNFARSAAISYIYIYMNDISKCSDYGQVARIFADDTNLTFSGCSFPALQNKMSKDLQIKMSKDLKDIASWLSANRLTLKCQKLILWI